MGWVDNDGNRSESLLQSGIDKIESVACGPFVFSFYEIEDVDNTSILIKLQEMKNRRIFVAREFADYLFARGIKFRIAYQKTESGLIENIKMKYKLLRLRLLFAWRQKHGR